MALTVPAYVYCVEADVNDLLSQEGVELRLDDDSTGAISTTERQVLTVKGIYWATSRVNLYLVPRYEASQLATSYIVNEWCTRFAARWLCSRRGNSPPASIEDLYQEAKEEMADVLAGKMQVPDIGARSPEWPLWSNIRFDDSYGVRKLRVERPISERTQAGYQQNIDWPAEAGFWEI